MLRSLSLLFPFSLLFGSVCPFLLEAVIPYRFPTSLVLVYDNADIATFTLCAWCAPRAIVREVAVG